GILLVFAALICTNAVVWFMRGHASLLLTFFPAFYIGIQIKQAEAAGWSRSAMLQVAGVTLAIAASFVVFDEFY
ncbi:hypothetical protein IAI15_38525, partial [Escherichia coli]|nr:hypothetical protein [Escherichia coli]